MIENKNIYKGLECHCNEFEKIPILKYHQSFAYGDINRNLNYFTIDFAPYTQEIESY